VDPLKLRYRVGTEAPISMKRRFPQHGYQSKEKGRKDQFDRFFAEHEAYYVGKVYPDDSTEILSMGLQALYTDACEFARKDPEYCRFILGILSGHLR